MNFHAFSTKLAKGRTLFRTYYYNILRDRERNPQAYDDQQKFLAALYKTPYMDIRLGGSKMRGDVAVEKGIDIMLATDMLRFAWNDLYDVAVLVSGDGDYAYAVQAVKDLGKYVEVAAFTSNLSYELTQVADDREFFTKTYFSDLWSRRRAVGGGARQEGGRARQQSGGARQESGEARQESGGARQESGEARPDSGRARQESGEARQEGPSGVGGPVRTVGGPVRKAERPVRTVGGPVRKAERPARTVGGPVRKAERPARTAGGPVRKAEKSVRMPTVPRRSPRAHRGAGAGASAAPGGRPAREKGPRPRIRNRVPAPGYRDGNLAASTSMMSLAASWLVMSATS